jgi:hypothetical protein
MTKVVFVGGKEFPAKVVGELLEKLPRETQIVTGVGVGLEKWVAEQGRELGFRVDVPPLYEEFFNYEESYATLKKPRRGTEGPAEQVMKKRVVNNARDLQVNTLFCEALHGTLVLVGKGGRVTAAKDILKRANWPLEVIEL